MQRPAQGGIIFSANGANPSGNGNPAEVWRHGRRSPVYGRFGAVYGVSCLGKGPIAVHGLERPGKWQNITGQRDAVPAFGTNLPGWQWKKNTPIRQRSGR